MSTRSLTDPLTALFDQSLLDSARTSLKRAAFWAAIALPFLYLPLLATGLDSETTTQAFVVLLVANVAALIVGHHYD